MKILIVENETYLAQNLANKLNDFGYICDVDTSGEFALDGKSEFDAILLSASLIGADFKEIIKRHAKSIIILMINYISSDVISAMKVGADDYILKPIIVEEIVRKINIFDSYKKFETLNKSYEKFILSLTRQYQLPNFEFKKLKLPLILVSNSSEIAQDFVFTYAKALNLAYEHIQARSPRALSEINKAKPQNLVFIDEIDELEESKQSEFINAISRKNIIIATKNGSIKSDWEKIILECKSPQIPNGEIVSIDEYVKFAITCYQESYTDVELSKRLGISRKSLWGKRKRYGISRK